MSAGNSAGRFEAPRPTEKDALKIYMKLKAVGVPCRINVSAWGCYTHRCSSTGGVQLGTLSYKYSRFVWTVFVM